MDATESTINDANRAAESANNKGVYQFEFSGRPGEFFKIWIVNIFLSIITLGIYSAWAKVRTKRYLYGSTSLAGSNFDYTADPIRILKGRAIAVTVFFIYQFVVSFAPQFSGLIILAVALLAPAAIVMSMRFSNINTTWRNIRFGFESNFKAAYLLFSLPILYFAVVAALPFLIDIDTLAKGNKDALESIPGGIYVLIFFGALIIAALAFPTWQAAYYRFIAANSRIGKTPFRLAITGGELFMIYLLAVVLFLGILAIASIFITTGSPIAVVSSTVLYLMAYVLAWAYITANRMNLIFSDLNLKGVEFHCRLSTLKLAGLYITNTFAIVFSLGLAVPWAIIRTTRYRAECLKMITLRIDEFVRSEEDDQNALGEEVGEIFGLDLGL